MRPVIAQFGVSVGQDVVSQLQAELTKARQAAATPAKASAKPAAKSAAPAAK
jgi:TRAP-type transport system periplasmic protein